MSRLAVLLLIFVMIGGCVSCVRRLPVDNIYKSATDRMEYASSVRIDVICENMREVFGTGVVISNHKVITAKHVIECNPVLIGVVYREGNIIKTVQAYILEKSPTVDVASLFTEVELPTRAVPDTEKPLVGEEVCSIGGGDIGTGWIKKCGYVFYFDDTNIFSSVNTVPGNSGSPLYDEDGYLVGIVVMGNWREGEEKYSGAIPTSAWKDLI